MRNYAYMYQHLLACVLEWKIRILKTVSCLQQGETQERGEVAVYMTTEVNTNNSFQANQNKTSSARLFFGQQAADY